MRHAFPSRMKSLLLVWLVLLTALLTLGWFYHRSLKQEILSDAKKNAVQALKLVEWVLLQHEDIRTAERLQHDVDALGKETGYRITYIAPGGRVLADSKVTFSEMDDLDNHATRPEIVQARKEEIGFSVRYSHTLKNELVYVAKAAALSATAEPGVLRLAIPLSTVKERFDILSKRLLGGIFVTFAVLAVVSYALIQQLNKPVRKIIAVTEAIGKGDYKQRIHFREGHDFYHLGRSINLMVELIDRQIQTITEQKQQLEAVFNGLKEGVMVLDSGGRIAGFNPALTEIIPSISQNIGRKPLEVTMSLELQKACDHVLSTGSDLESYPYSLQVVLRGGESTYDVSIVKLPHSRSGMGAIVVFHDISELKRLEKVRHDFVANVSHELRTPLTSIKGYSETLLAEDQHAPETLRSFLQIILKNTNHMSKMVDDLLQLARLEARPSLAVAAPVDASEALMTAWKACIPLAEAKGVKIEHHLPDDGPKVMIDFDQLVQVFRNLLENAIKYSPSEEVIRIAHRSEGGKETFSVTDRGPGIPRQHQQRVFERFYRVEKHRGDHPGSTGLGLSICRHIIMNHGGRIWVSSPADSEGIGTSVSFTLHGSSHGTSTAADGRRASLPSHPVSDGEKA